MEIVEYKNDLEKADYIENKIYKIRDKYVMLDNDLAILYGCKNGTKTINQAVKRHKERFPERFMFRLTNEEIENLWSQTGTANYKMTRSLPYAFTEQGVAMLATILKTDTATQISIKIMDAFIAMKKYIKNNNYSSRINNLETKCLEHDTKIKLLEASFNEFDKKKVINEIYFDGQIYDAYSKIVDIFKSCKKSLIIIDSYADKYLLDIIRNINISVTLITKKMVF